jgi:hypothetical protein
VQHCDGVRDRLRKERCLHARPAGAGTPGSAEKGGGVAPEQVGAELPETGSGERARWAWMDGGDRGLQAGWHGECGRV